MYINSNLVSKTLKGEQAALIKQIFTVLTLRFIRIPFEFTCDSSLLQTIEVKCMGRLTNISWQRFV